MRIVDNKVIKWISLDKRYQPGDSYYGWVVVTRIEGIAYVRRRDENRP